MERNTVLGAIVIVIIIIVLLLIIRSTAPRPAVVLSTPLPTPIVYATPEYTPTPISRTTPAPTITTRPTSTPKATANPTPGPTVNPIIYPSGSKTGQVLGLITNKAPFENGSYIVSVETPSLQSFDVFVSPDVPIYSPRGESMGINYLAVGQTVQVATLPASTDFTAQSISVMNNS